MYEVIWGPYWRQPPGRENQRRLFLAENSPCRSGSWEGPEQREGHSGWNAVNAEENVLVKGRGSGPGVSRSPSKTATPPGVAAPAPGGPRSQEHTGHQPLNGHSWAVAPPMLWAPPRQPAPPRPVLGRLRAVGPMPSGRAMALRRLGCKSCGSHFLTRLGTEAS
uniref:Uncharacterized protein n=1 Tax=Myotis myotis TaxID=51298 RepID=A0A7J7T5K5_MYOMY|nr:hypothetical protein mMyoMyo1_009118 [Myotis myotis]